MIMAILDAIGLTDKLIRDLKAEGLKIPKAISPNRRAFKTPGEDWLYYAADLFTPQLSRKEIKRYINNPDLFCDDLINRLLFFSKVSDILYKAGIQIDNQLRDKEALVGYMIILYIFHVCGDENYYKYDRHLEYYEHEESPVGYYYKRLQEFCLTAAQRKNVENSDEWAAKTLLDIMASPLDERVGMPIEYLLACKDVHNRIVRVIGAFQNLSPDSLLERVKNLDKVLYQEVLRKSNIFFKHPNEFVADCVRGIEFDIEKEILRSKQKAREAYSEVDELLEGRDKNKFAKAVSAIHVFSLTQQKEGFIFGGITPSGNHLLDPFFLAYEKIKEIVNKNPEFVAIKHQEKMQSILEEGNPVLGARKLVQSGSRFLTTPIQKLYKEELSRWL